MITDRLKAAALAGVASVALATAADAGVFVDSTSATPVAIGTVTNGQQFHLSVLGQTTIYQPTALTLTPTGAPAWDFTGTPNAGYMPSGSPNVPGTSTYGVAGASVNLGALIGTYNANPTQASDYFLIGNGGNFTATQSGTLYAVINQNYYAGDCGGAFVSMGSAPATTQTNIACAAVPGSLSPAPIASLSAGHVYQFSASGSAFLGDGGPGTVTNPAGLSPLLNGYNTGALLLSLVPNPTSAQILAPGASYRFTAPTDATLYAWVNAASYWANTGGFVTQVTDVPEPMSLSLLLTGLGMVWIGKQSRARKAA